MKLKASPRARKIVVELDTKEDGLPPIVAPDIKLQKILVPIDFSELSRKALQYALTFSRVFGGEIFLLHVVEFVPTPEVVVAETEYLNASLRETAAQQLSEWRKEIPGVSVKASIQDGIPFREIVRIANEINADLIILGTQGRTGLSHLFIGSTAERVVRHAGCPVMVVREREHDFVEGKKESQQRLNSKGKLPEISSVKRAAWKK